jgi:two-component system chemotaxis response regulator CheB
MANKIRVLVVDDSAVIRKLLTRILTTSEIEVVGTAIDPYQARDKLVELKPDVMTLDIEMPKMDGISFLEKVMKHFPVRTLIVSSLAREGSETALRGLEVGAVDIIEKPSLDVTNSMEEMAKEIQARVKAVALARMPVPGDFISSKPQQTSKKNPLPNSAALHKTTHQVIAIASSTGGTEALKVVLKEFPPDIPATVIVQHMPAGYTEQYANNLNTLFPFEVREAKDGDKLVPGLVLIAPGNFHMEIVRSGGYYLVKIHQEPAMHGVRPAADYLMKSVAKYAGSNAVGVVLTGMGKDGASGLLEMKKMGATTFAQDEASCVVFGMPQAAINIGAIDKVLPLNRIGKFVVEQIKKQS